ncbi:MAG TPA: hypothetical protein VFP88_06365, partial [Rhodanobacteraceae bacterium]|nr:hypothetical protein [Rhodanobacteraceae bacterium]
MGRVFAPVVEIGGVDRAHVHWQTRLLEPHRHQDAAIGRLARLATHPARRHRRRRPDHQHCPRRGNLRVDLIVEFLARRDLRIPPHRPALRLDRGD